MSLCLPYKFVYVKNPHKVIDNNDDFNQRVTFSPNINTKECTGISSKDMKECDMSVMVT